MEIKKKIKTQEEVAKAKAFEQAIMCPDCGVLSGEGIGYTVQEENGKHYYACKCGHCGHEWETDRW